MYASETIQNCKNPTGHIDTLRVFFFNFLICFLGPYLNFSGKVVPVVLESFVSGPQVALPPVNWASVLGPISRAKFGKQSKIRTVSLIFPQKYKLYL